MSKILGTKGERLAEEFLRKNGYEILERNFRYDRAEIDLIVRKENTVVFCEVKTRKSDVFGVGEDAVDPKKRNQIRKAAEGYIAGRGLEDNEFRFDVIVVDVAGYSTRIRVIEDAF